MKRFDMADFMVKNPFVPRREILTTYRTPFSSRKTNPVNFLLFFFKYTCFFAQEGVYQISCHCLIPSCNANELYIRVAEPDPVNFRLDPVTNWPDSTFDWKKENTFFLSIITDWQISMSTYFRFFRKPWSRSDKNGPNQFCNSALNRLPSLKDIFVTFAS